MLGSEVHAPLKRVKSAFDPEGIFNPQKVLGAAPPLDRDLRAAIRRDPVPTYFDWHEDGGLLGAAERCNGSGACRKRAGRAAPCVRPTWPPWKNGTVRAAGPMSSASSWLDRMRARRCPTTTCRRSWTCAHVQGLQVRMPGLGGHGAHEVGVPAAPPRSARPAAARAGARGARAHPAPWRRMLRGWQVI